MNRDGINLIFQCHEWHIHPYIQGCILVIWFKKLYRIKSSLSILR